MLTPTSGTARDKSAEFCKQGVTSSSLVSSTPTYQQVMDHFDGLTVDLHETFFPRRARCVPDRFAVPRVRLVFRLSSRPPGRERVGDLALPLVGRTGQA